MSKYNQDILKHYGMTKQGRSNPMLSQAFVAVQPVAKDFDRLITDIEWGIEAEIGDGLDNGDDLRLLSLKTKREWLDVVVGMSSGSYDSPPEEIDDEAHVVVEVELKVQQKLSTQTLFRRFMSDTGSVADKREYGSLLTTVLKDSGAMKRVEKVILSLAKQFADETAEYWNTHFEDQLFDEIQYFDSKGGNLDLTTSTLLPYTYKLKSVNVKFAGKGFVIDYDLVGKVDKNEYKGNIEMSDSGSYGRWASFNNDVLGHYGISKESKTAGRGGLDDLEKILGAKVWRRVVLTRRNLHGANPLMTNAANTLSDCIDALAKRVEMDPKTAEGLELMRWLNDSGKAAQNMAYILDLAKTLGVRASFTPQDVKEQSRKRLAYKRVLFRQVKSVLKKARLLDKVEMGGRSTEWQITCPDERTKNKVTKALRAEDISVGGYRTGWGGWVLSQTYQSSGDWNDPSSRHHYASQEKTAGGHGIPLMKDIGVGPNQIKKACYAASDLRREFLDGLDFRKVEFGKIMQNWMGSTGPTVLWTVYTKGEYGNDDADYISGWVSTKWDVGSKGIKITGEVVVRY